MPYLIISARSGSETRRALFGTASVLAVTMLTIGSAATAQTTPVTSPSVSDSSVSDIVVTANKRGGQSLIDAPQSIQALTGDSLQKAGNVQFIDIAAKIPGLQIQDLGPGDKKYVIRGINSTGDSTTGVYYDEAVISGSNPNDGGGLEPDIRLYDLDRVEVLRGPQGTLYGASSESGTIRFITKKPNFNTVDGYVTAEGSGTQHGSGNYHVNGALNIPIVNDTLAARVVGWYDNDSGFIDQPRIPSGALKGINNEVTKGGRLHVRWAPTENLDFLASVTAQNSHSNGSSRYTPAGITSFGVPGDPILSPIAGGDLINTDVVRSPYNEHLEIYSLTGNYQALGGTFTATVNQFNRKFDFNFDSTPILVSFGVPVAAVTQQPQKRQVTSSELRYASKFDGPINFVVGGFYERTDFDLSVAVLATDASGLPIGPFSSENSADALAHPGTGSTFFGRTDHRGSDQYAGFGEVTFDITSKFQVVGGLRYFAEDTNGVQVQTHPFGGFPASPVLVETPEKGSFHKLTYKVNASYKLDPAALLYATVSTGFRSGGVNSQDQPFEPIPLSYGPDSLTNYEGGAKGRLFDGRVTYNADAYYIVWTNIQVANTTTDGAFRYTGNAGKAEVKGVELELNARLFDYLSATVSGSYQDARLTKGQVQIDPANPDLALGVKGDHIQNVPKWQGFVGLDYTRPINENLKGIAAIDISYRGSADNQLHAANPYNVHLEAYTMFNLRLGVSNKDWAGTFFVRNLTNKRAQIDAINSSQDPTGLLTVRPRTIGATVTRSF
ncbi:TonB-dependent receptor [Sphingosinicellaceae bacterium]|nr:TonB-dependent receptor [Sphingosinicellaceae bacterium]